GHHHWLVDIDPGKRIEFTFKHHVINRRGSFFPPRYARQLTPDERVQMLWWEGSFEYAEVTHGDPATLDLYLEAFVKERMAAHPRATRRWDAYRRARLLAAKVLRH
ncbi:MAG: hypothetical protein ACRDKS_01630, partial [Actinomycetota bacterium]